MPVHGREFAVVLQCPQQHGSGHFRGQTAVAVGPPWPFSIRRGGRKTASGVSFEIAILKVLQWPIFSNLSQRLVRLCMCCRSWSKFTIEMHDAE